MSTTPRGPRVLGRVGLAAAVLGALVACGGPEVTTDDVVANGDAGTGAVLYQNNCAACHGADLNGTAQGPPFLDEIYEPDHHADASFRVAIERGVQPHHWDFGPMPSIGGLSDTEVNDIITYVREQQRAVGIE